MFSTKEISAATSKRLLALIDEYQAHNYWYLHATHSADRDSYKATRDAIKEQLIKTVRRVWANRFGNSITCNYSSEMTKVFGWDLASQLRDNYLIDVWQPDGTVPMP